MCFTTVHSFKHLNTYEILSRYYSRSTLYLGLGPTSQNTEGERQMPKPYIAINSAKVANHPDSFRLFESVGPKVCMVTANHSGFVGFQNHVQIGVFPMGGRYGGAEMDMRQTLNPLGIRQYTMWKRWEDHEEMHVQQFDSIFRLCSSCLGMVIEGPWEPIYEIVSRIYQTIWR